jgi:hypothetical protein
MKYFKTISVILLLLIALCSCKNNKPRHQQKDKEKIVTEVLAKTDSLVASSPKKIIYDTIQVSITEQEPERVVVVENKPKEDIFNLSTFISIAAAIVSILALWFTWTTHRKTVRAAITKEFIELNSLNIANPMLKLIYQGKNKADIEINLLAFTESSNSRSRRGALQAHIVTSYNERLRSYCYKYLNLFDMINNEYHFINRSYYKKRIKTRNFTIKWWYRKRKKEKIEWLDFYAHNFAKHLEFDPKQDETKGYELIKKILDKARNNRAYNTKFIEFTLQLMENDKT